MLLDTYEIVEEIGEGSFGKVYKAKKKGSNVFYAIKEINLDKQNNDYRKYIEREIKTLKELNHKNILKYICHKKTNQKIYVVTEYCNGGNLGEALVKYRKKYNTNFPQELVQIIMRQLVSALKYIHSKHILHRDIKMDNIMLNYKNEKDKDDLNINNAVVKIIDFGLTRKLIPGELANSIVGSPLYMDPKILKRYCNSDQSNDFKYEEKVDIWSLGIVCYEMIVGKPTFYSESKKELLSKVERGSYEIPNNLYLSREIVSFLNGMLKYNEKERLNSNELSRHYFLRKEVKTFETIVLNKPLNTKSINESLIWNDFENSQIYDKIDPKMLEPEDIDNELKNEIEKLFDKVNENFIVNEKKLLPIIPCLIGKDPTLLNEDFEL